MDSAEFIYDCQGFRLYFKNWIVIDCILVWLLTQILVFSWFQLTNFYWSWQVKYFVLELFRWNLKHQLLFMNDFIFLVIFFIVSSVL